MTRRAPHRRAFAVAMAVTLLGLIGVTLVALAVLLAADVRRTRDLEAEAQLRQLLLAGEAAAASRLDAGQRTEGELDIPLPPAMAGDGATLTLHSTGVSPDVAEITVHATIGQRTAAQTLRYARRQQGWSLESTSAPLP